MDLSIGVLTVGSLLWDQRKHRDRWRESRLDRLSEHAVWAPIRYGRRSSKRGDTYTMMIAPELEEQEKLGRAVVVPCVNRVTSPEDLIVEAEALWAAEQDEPRDRGPVSASWGSVGLLPNPASDIPDRLLRHWAKRVAEEKQYARLLVPSSARHPLSTNGMLAVSWPTCVQGSVELGIDLLLATATGLKEPRKEYPSPEEVADAWNNADEKHALYFHNNCGNRITTFEDDDIKLLLHPPE